MEKTEQTTKTSSSSSSSSSTTKAMNGGIIEGCKIVFNADDKHHCYEVSGQNVTVIGNAGKHDHGSSKIKLKNLVDYKWEQRNYPGRLIACHNQEKLIAYAIKVNHHNVTEGMVRIVHLSLSQRALIKGMSGEVLDLQFAHIASEYLLGIIESTALHVHRVEIHDDKISTQLHVKIIDPIDGHVPVCDKICWCPYLQDSDTVDDYVGQLLVWTRGSTFQSISISTVTQIHGMGELHASSITGGVLTYSEGSAPLTGGLFSPDGSTLAVSDSDGVIRFYQVYQHTSESNPRCLHKWKPHGGKAVSSFFFLDNYTEPSDTDQSLWKHAVTCADNNTEIKVWSCVTWECTQTVRFVPSIEQPLNFKVEIDPTSSYLILSDVSTRELYVLMLQKEVVAPNGTLTNGASENVHSNMRNEKSRLSSPTNLSETGLSSSTRAYVSTIAEFPLSSPILSFGILKAGMQKFKSSDAYLIDELDEYDEDSASTSSVVIHLFLVQPKSVQECHLFYQPANASAAVEVIRNEAILPTEIDDMKPMKATVPSKASSDASSPADDVSDDGNAGSSQLTGTIKSNEGGGGGVSDGGGGGAKTSAAAATGDTSIENAAKRLNDAILRTSVSPVHGTGSNSTSTATTPGTGTKMNLMTPDSFNTSAERTVATDVTIVRIFDLPELTDDQIKKCMRRYGRIKKLIREKYDKVPQWSHVYNGVFRLHMVLKRTPPMYTYICGYHAVVHCGTATPVSPDLWGRAQEITFVTPSPSVDEGENDKLDNGGDGRDEQQRPPVADVGDGKATGSERETKDYEGGGGHLNTSTSSVTTTASSSNGGDSGSGVGNTSIASIAGSDRLSTGGGGGGDGGEQTRSVQHDTASTAALVMDSFAKILTLDETEPPTVREKIKKDETVNPEVLSTLFMLANVTKQQKLQQQQQPSQQSQSQSQQQQQPPQLTESSPSAVPKPKPSPLESMNVLNIMNSAMIEEQEKQKIRKSVELQQTAAALETPPVPPMPSAEMLASGGSSPSREVQEIMSLKGSDCLTEYYDYMFQDEADGIGGDDDDLNDDDEDDDLDDDDEDEQPAPDVKPKTNGEQQQQQQQQKETTTVEQAAKSIPVANNNSQEQTTAPKVVTKWPKVTEVPLHSRKSFSPTEMQAQSRLVAQQQAKQLDELNAKFDRMLELLQVQSRQITALRSQVHDLNKSKIEQGQQFQATLAKINGTLPKFIEDGMANNRMLITAKTDQLLTLQNQQHRHLQETLHNTVTQVVLTQLSERFPALVVTEMQRHIIPVVGSKLECMTRMMQGELANRWKTIEATMRETIDMICRSQPFIEALSMSMQNGVRKGMEKTYQESLRTVILPAYEKATRELLRQLCLSFSNGTKEYVQKLDQYMVRYTKSDDRATELIDTVEKIPKQMLAESDRMLRSSTRTLREDIDRDLKVLQAGLVKTVRESIRQEIEKGFEAQASSLEDSVLSVVRSQSQTPAPTNMDIQEQIKQYLSAGRINKAFHKALLSNDLALVEFTLEKADYKSVFNPCPLEQTVLLSLIQQISADMANHNELKQRYLSDALVSLNLLDPIAKEHAPKVMRELNANCQTFLTANPGNPLCTNIKMLMIAIQFLGLKQF